ncbi:hypothetical protein FS842_003055 [Serendipita sp. 407]|nr:hypothetical protein FS842_003055 [Serendipita sp. 407]
MPTAIAPRYGSAPTNIPWFRNNAQNRFDLSVSVQMNKPITSISSPSHPIGLTLGCHQRELSGDYEPSKAFVYLGDSAMLDKDIVLVISAQGMDTPRCSVERWLKSEGGEETTDAYALTLVPKFELPALPNQEYIFLVDRSGSMGGGRITAVKAALQILLRSLPSRGTSFNIVSFGSHYSSLWPNSQTYSSESMEQASKHVDGFEANYGGTKLRSAIEFAFNSRQDVNAGSTNQSEKIPTSVFVLTDGKAWDLDGIINIINLNCGNSKKSGSLLRAFTLGVGNQVSMAMCEGIARAGQGTAVFVAEGEKPDAKLMGLLKAARGGVIEDLAVDWGDSEDSVEEEDDEFEMISSSKADDNPESSTSPPPQSQPPLNLFDESHVETPVEVGAQKSIVLLGPPPKVQQAPKSDKLPIPLYPGFRCSIFAIVKRGANPGPHCASVKITGKVLGREVILQVPVSPVSVHSGIVAGKVDSGKLLHTLAAKALIQAFEDMAKTPENKAQIERLGKRYSLASSVTSFVAIDEDTKDEIQEKEEEVAVHQKKDRRRDFNMGTWQPVVRSRTSNLASSAVVTRYTSSPAHIGRDSSSATSGFDSYGRGAAPSYRRSMAAPSQPIAPGGPAMASYQAPDMLLSQESRSSVDAEISAIDEDTNDETQEKERSAAEQEDEVLGNRTREAVRRYVSLGNPSQRGSGASTVARYTASAASTGLNSSSITTEFGAYSEGTTAFMRSIATLPPTPVNLARRTLRVQNSSHSSSDEEEEEAPMSLCMYQVISNTPPESPLLRPQSFRGSGRGSGSRGGFGELSISRGVAPRASSQPHQPNFAPLQRPAALSVPQYSPRSPPMAEPSSTRTLSIESIARAQNFDGSFPCTDNHLRFIVGTDRLSRARELPSTFKQIGGENNAQDATKKLIWATVITFVCLQKKFEGEKGSWEMLVEKAKEYIEKELVELGLKETLVAKTVNELESVASALF